MAVVLEHLLVQVSSISCNVVGSIACLENPGTAIVGDWWTAPRPILISFELPMVFQYFVVINKMHP